MHSFRICAPITSCKLLLPAPLLVPVLTGVVITSSPSLGCPFSQLPLLHRKTFNFVSISQSPNMSHPLTSFWGSKCSRAQPWNYPSTFPVTRHHLAFYLKPV